MNSQSIALIGDELINIVRDIFPDRAEIESCYGVNGYDYVCTIYWKLNNDLTRPNKATRIIVIIVPREVIEDADYENRKLIVNERFRAFIKLKYNEFSPDHDEPYGKPPPIEKWIVDGASLNR